MKNIKLKGVLYLFWLLDTISKATDRQIFESKVGNFKLSLSKVTYQLLMSKKRWNINEKFETNINFNQKKQYIFKNFSI